MATSNGRNEILELLGQLEDLNNRFNFVSLESVLDVGWSKIGEYLDLKPDVIRNIARRCGLPPSLIVLCSTWLCNYLEKRDNGIVARKISQAVRYSVRKFYDGHSSHTDTALQEQIFSLILKAYSGISDPEIQSQLTWALGYLVPNVGLSLPDIFTSNKNINERAKKFLFEQIRRKNSERKSLDSICDSSLPNLGRVDYSPSIRNRAGVYVTQTQTAIAVKDNHFESEKTKVLLLSLFETFKAKKDRYKVSNRFVTPKEEAINEGSDRKWFRDTYHEVKNLLDIAESDCIKLRHEDVNVYLEGKLLGYHYWTWSWGGKSWEELNIDISKIILIYSKTRPLEDNLIEKLFKCLSPTLSHFSWANLGILRYNSIQALYNCSLKKAVFPPGDKVLCTNRLNVIINCNNFDCSRKSEVSQVVFAILKNCAEDNSESILFQMAIDKLKCESCEENVEEYLQVVRKLTWDQSKADNLFTSDVKSILVKIVASGNHSMLKRKGCADIIHSYLTFSSGLLDSDHFRELVNVIHVHQSGRESLLKAIFPSIILGLEKGCRNSKFNTIFLNEIVDSLASCIGKVGDTLSYYAIIALAKAVDQKDVVVRIGKDLVDKLFDDTRVVEKTVGIEFAKCTDVKKEEDSGIAISYYVADICLKTLKKTDGYMVGDNITIEILLKCLEENLDKQTRICVAEILYCVRKYFSHSISVDIFPRLADLAKDPVVDVRILSLAVYVKFLSEESMVEISDDDMSDIADFFVYDQLTLDEKDFTDEINDCVMTIFKNAANNYQNFPDKVFDIFNYILGVDKYYVDPVLRVLSMVVSSKKEIPLPTMYALENALCHENQKARLIFKMCIENGQQVPEKVIDLLVKDLYVQDNEVRFQAFILLDKADENQDLGDLAFSTLEMERAGRIYGTRYSAVDTISSLRYLWECVNSGKILTPYNFKAFSEMIGANKDITISIIAILLVVSENGQPVPDFLLTKLNGTINVKSDKNAISSFCKLISHVLHNNQIISNSAMIKEKLKQFMELELDGLLFSAVFQAMLAIVKRESNDDGDLQLPDKIVQKLMQKILSDEFCRNSFMKLLPKIIASSKSMEVKNQGKTFFRRCISSTEENIAFYSALGFLELSKLSILNNSDLKVLLKYAAQNDDKKVNEVILEIVSRYDLTPEMVAIRECITAEKDVHYYFERLKISEEQDDRVAVKKYLFCVKDIFSSDNFIMIKEAIQILKFLSLNKNMISAITPDIVSALITTGYSNNDEDLVLSIYEIVNKIVDLKQQFFLSITDIDKLCEFAKENRKHKKRFRELLNSILDKNLPISTDAMSKIEMTLFFANNRINSLESIEAIKQKVIDGASLDLDQVKAVIKDIHEIVEGKSNTLSDMRAKLLLTFADLFSMLLIQGKVNLAELQLDGTDLYALLIIEYIISHSDKMPIENAIFISACKIVLKHATSLPDRDMECYFEFIESIFRSSQMDNLKFQLSAAQYILTCIECCHFGAININLYPYVVSWLENGLKNTNNILRMYSFDSLRSLHLKGHISENFQEWCLSRLDLFSTSTKISLNSEELNEENLRILHTISLCRFINYDLENTDSLSSVLTEILTNELFQRYFSDASELSKHNFSNDFVKLSSKQFYSSNPELFCKLLENLVLAIDQEMIINSDLNSVILFLSHIDFETFITVINNQGYNLVNELRVIATHSLIFDKLKDPIKDSETAKRLVSEAEGKIEFQDLILLLNQIEGIDSLEQMNSVFNFFRGKGLSIKEMSLQKCKSPSEMLKQLHVYHLTRKMSPIDKKLKSKELLRQLFEKGFDCSHLEFLFQAFDKTNEKVAGKMAESVISILILIIQFGLDPKNHYAVSCIDRIRKVVKENPSDYSVWFTKANLDIVNYVFKNDTEDISSIKSLKMVLKELRANNSQTFSTFVNVHAMIESLCRNVQNIKQQDICRVTFVNQHYDNLDRYQKRCRNTNISVWEKDDFCTWAKEVKQNPLYFSKDGFIEEALAVLLKANFKCSGFQLRDTQILSCLLAMSSDRMLVNRGLLQQVVTGGGKSTIIRLLAILLALQGRNVFIVTSNPVLAERDAHESRQFFELFNLTVDHNRDKQNYIRGPKSCYSKSVVFGDAAQFMFDILRHEYSCLDTLDKWELDVVIVDEVDNMFIDDSSKCTRLSSSLPGMDQLQLIYHFVWNKLNEVQSRIFRIEERTFLALGKLHLNENGILSIDRLIENGQIVHIENFREYILAGNETNGLCIEIEDIHAGISDHLKNRLFALLTDKRIKGYELKPEDKMLIPSHLKSFAESQIPRWVENALTALQYMENVHYIIDKETIKPVDFDTTGVIQSSTSWSDGLHQFLQIKHNLPMTSENLATNYLSTVGFFKRFQSRNIFGFTGTFGSKAAKIHTSQLYNVDLIKIPNSSIKRYFHYEDLIVQTKKDWISAILKSTEFETRKNRACLIICRTIKEAESIYQVLSQNALRPNSVKLYTSNLTNEEKSVEKIGAGEVIVATNLAGRGTDIKTDKTIEKNGGLHVCMTFLPPSQRAEDQAIGRTSRLDNLGTAQFILLGSLGSNKSLRRERDEAELKLLQEFRAKDLQTINVKDTLFKRFCKLLQFVREKLRLQKSVTGKVATFFGRNLPSVYETNMLNAVEERWALFVRQVESMSIEDDGIRISEAYNEFEREIRPVFEDEPKKYINVIKSPYYATCIGNDYVYNGQSKLAVEYFDYAIELDENFSAAAFVGKAWCLVSPESRFYFFNGSYGSDYKDLAMQSMEKALKLLETEKAYLSNSHVLSSNSNEETGLSRQLLEKLNILGNYINSVEMAISTVRKSQRLIDISCSVLNVGQDMIKREELLGKSRKNTLNERFLSDEYSIDVTFHDLTSRYDCGTKDQAIDIISWSFNVFGFRPLNVQIKGSDSDNVLAFLSPHVEHRLLSKDAALKIFIVVRQRSRLNRFKRKAIHIISKTRVSSKIDCTIFKTDGTVENLCGKTEKEIKEMILESDELSTFNLKLYDVNDTYQKLKNKRFDLSLFQIGKEKAVEIFSTIDTDVTNTSLTITLIGKTEELIAYCRNPLLKGRKFNLILQKDNSRIIKSMVVAPEYLESISGEFSCVELPMSVKDASKLFSGESPMKFSMDIRYNFLDLNTAMELLKVHKGGRIDFAINTDAKFAMEVIPLLRDAKFDFALKFLYCSHCEANALIKSSTVKEEDIIFDKNGTKKLPSLFLQEHDPKEVIEFMSRGLEYLLVFNERRFIPWYSIASVCAIGALQLTIGGLLIGTGLGAPVGMALCTEGAVDLMIATRTYKTRDFSWKDYGMQKSVSLLISGASLGLGAFKSAGQGITSVVQGIWTEAAEQGAVKIILNGKTIYTVAAESAASLKTLAFKYVGITVAEAAARESLFQISNSVSSYLFNQFEDTIEASVSRSLKIAISKSSLLDLLTRLSVYEEVINFRTKNSIKNIVLSYLDEIVSPDNNSWKNHWNSIGLMVCQGVASSSQSLNNPIALGTRLFTMLWGTREIANMENNLCQQLLKKLVRHEERAYSLVHIVEQRLNLSPGDAKIFADVISKHCEVPPASFYDLINNQDSLSMISHIRLNAFQRMEIFGDDQLVNDTRERFVTLCRNVNCKLAYKGDPFDRHSELIKSIVNAATQQIVQVSHSQLITPASSLAIGHFVRKVSNYVQANHIVSQGENSTSQNKNQMKYDELMKQYVSAGTLPKEDMDFVNTFKDERQNMTIARQISHNANDLQTAKNLMRINRSLPQGEHSGMSGIKIVNSEQTNYAKNIEFNGKKAGLLEIVHLSEVHNVKLIVTDDVSEVEGLRQKFQDHHVLVYNEKTNPKSAFQLFDSNGKAIIISESDNADKGYKYLEHLTGQKEIDLRKRIANDIVNDKSLQAKIKAEGFVQKFTTYGQGNREKLTNSLFSKGVEKFRETLPSIISKGGKNLFSSGPLPAVNCIATDSPNSLAQVKQQSSTSWFTVGMFLLLFFALLVYVIYQLSAVILTAIFAAIVYYSVRRQGNGLL